LNKTHPNRVAEVMRAQGRRITSVVTKTGLSAECVRAIMEQTRPLPPRTAGRIARALEVKPEELMLTKLPARTKAVRVEVTKSAAALAPSELSLLIELCEREEADLRSSNRNVLAEMYAGMARKLKDGDQKPPSDKPKVERPLSKRGEAGKSSRARLLSVPISRPFSYQEMTDIVMLTAADDTVTAAYFAELLKRPESDISVFRATVGWLFSAVRNHGWDEGRVCQRLREWVPQTHPNFVAQV
jgi:hypothetical protein